MSFIVPPGFASLHSALESARSAAWSGPLPPIETSAPLPDGLDRLRTIAAAAFLFLAPFPASAGWRLFALLVAGAVLVAEAMRRGRGSLPPRLPRSLALAGAAWTALCVASLAWTTDLPYTRAELRAEILYGALAFGVFYAGTRTVRDVHIAVRVLMGGALLLGLFEWIGFFFPGNRYAPRYAAIHGYFSTHLVLVAPLLAVMAWRRPQGLELRRAVLIATAAGLVAAGLATENRMLWFALAAAAVAGFAAYRRAFPEGRPVFRGWIGISVLVALVAAASWQHKAATYYPQAANPVEALVFDQRPLIWRTGVDLFLERPLLGYGFGREIVGDAIEAKLTAAGLPLRHAHNVFLDAALQLGVVGALAFAALLAALARHYLRALRERDQVLAGVVGLAVLAGYVVKSLTDDFHHRPDSLVFWALQGLLLGILQRRGAQG